MKSGICPHFSYIPFYFWYNLAIRSKLWCLPVLGILAVVSNIIKNKPQTSNQPNVSSAHIIETLWEGRGNIVPLPSSSFCTLFGVGVACRLAAFRVAGWQPAATGALGFLRGRRSHAHQFKLLCFTLLGPLDNYKSLWLEPGLPKQTCNKVGRRGYIDWFTPIRDHP